MCNLLNRCFIITFQALHVKGKFDALFVIYKNCCYNNTGTHTEKTSSIQQNVLEVGNSKLIFNFPVKLRRHKDGKRQQQQA